MQLVILAGGFGTRLSEETDTIPKPMVKIGEKPIIWHIIKYYSCFGFNDFIICGGYKVNILYKYFSHLKEIWNVKVINTGIGTNTGERIKRIKKFINGDFCLTYGDGLSDVNIHSLIKFHKKKNHIITLTGVRPIPKYGKLFFKGNLVYKFCEKDAYKENWINGGFFVCSKKIFRYFKKVNSIFETDVLIGLVNEKKVLGYKHHGFWYCMDTLRDKRYLNSLWNLKKAPWKIWK
jgi:glucose-1-phosphate cytidylyltransferase